MSTTSKIQWTDRTWNPTRGCTRVSEGCRHCYAERQAWRFAGPGRPYEGLVNPQTGVWNGRIRLVPEALDEPLRWQKPSRIFVDSMSDLFHEAVPDHFIDEIFATMGACEDAERGHVFQVLTKRPVGMLGYMTKRAHSAWNRRRLGRDAFPPRNVWLGVSVENQETADERIPLLLQTPAAVRFVSVEPLLGPVDLTLGFPRVVDTDDGGNDLWHPKPDQGLDWVIVGGESGPRARPCDVAWIRSIVAQCKATGVPCFVKQFGANIVDRNDVLGTDRPPCEPYMWPEPECGWDDRAGGNIERIAYGYQGAPLRIRLQDRKGGDPAEWPANLRVREWPR